MIPIAAIKRAAIPRAGYEFQDLAGIEVLIRHFRDPELYAWVALEADDTAYRALDDVVAARKDGSYELVQVKFTVDPSRYRLDWDWLLSKSDGGSSLLEKWARTLARVGALGPVHAGLKTNRVPNSDFAAALQGGRVQLDLLRADLRTAVEAACGGAASAKVFFRAFDFSVPLPDLNRYEVYLRDQLVPTDTDALGWLALKDAVRQWATYKNLPGPNGQILRQHVVQLITKRRPEPIRQDFAIPDGYVPPSATFDILVRKRIATDASPLTIIWGTPGLGKSTYLSFLTRDLQKDGAAVTRHHYFLTAEDSSSNRSSFVEISTSLVAQLTTQHPDVMVGGSDEPDKLRSTLAIAAANLAGKNQRLYVVIDGLDHVWRDTQRVDQLNHLFNEFPE